LSRINEINSVTTQHSSESSGEYLIPSIEVPIFAFKNQILIKIKTDTDYNFSILYPTFHRHIISQPEYDNETLVKILKKYLNPSVKNGIFTEEKIMGEIQKIEPQHFRNDKSRFNCQRPRNRSRTRGNNPPNS